LGVRPKEEHFWTDCAEYQGFFRRSGLGHNYAKPLTAELRMTRVLARLPEDWNISIERIPGEPWRVSMQPPGHAGYCSAPHAELVDALEEAWRAVR